MVWIVLNCVTVFDDGDGDDDDDDIVTGGCTSCVPCTHLGWRSVMWIACARSRCLKCPTTNGERRSDCVNTCNICCQMISTCGELDIR